MTSNAWKILLPVDGSEDALAAVRLALQSIHAGPQASRASLRAGPQQIERWRRMSACPAIAAAR